MTLQADNAYGIGKRLVSGLYVDDNDLGVPAGTLPDSGVNAGRVKHIDIDISASFNETDNDIETNETSGNTLLQAKGTATIVMGDVTGTSDEQEDFNGLLAEGYVNQSVSFNRSDLVIDASGLISGAEGTIDIIGVLEKTLLNLWQNTGIQNQLEPDGSRSSFSGTISDTPAP